MAELYFQNLGVAQPAAVQRAVYRYLQSFYQFLERAKVHLENTRPELGWKLLGFPAVLEAPRGTRNIRAWQTALSQLLERKDLTIVGAGAVITVLTTHPDRSIAVFDALPQRNVVFELRAAGEENALPVQLTSLGEDMEALQKSLGSEGVWIELEDPDDEDGEKILEAFFDEDTKAVYEVDPKIDARKDRYPRERYIRVQDSDRERLALKVDRLPKTREICVQPNTYTIRCQMSAIRALEDQPLAEHRPLIRLFEELNPFAWPIPTPLSERLTWKELKDADRPGTLEQREFVERAMTTRDFMVLEGPPGSGKTTAIVELILQYAARGRRVLLCASTHVAVDNVIERLKDPERKGDQVLLVRIGKEKRVSDLVKPYRLETMVETELQNLRTALRAEKQPSRAQEHMRDALQGEKGMETVKRILLDSADVVCGTTIGILKHPDIEELMRSRQPWEPIFDALILDEASKTPVAEFLVPALLAKRWIVVGDRRQLSPYVDESWIQTNVEAALPDGVLSRTDLGTALLDTFEVARAHRASAIVVASDRDEVRKFYAAHAKGTFPEEPIVELDDRNTPNEFTLGVARAVIGTVAQIEKVESALPLATTVMRIHDGVLPTMQRRINARASRESKEPTNHRKHGRRRKKAEPIWSEEMSWRIVRDYELRMLPELLTDSEGNAGQADVYRREMDLMLPKGDLLPRVQDDVGQVRRVALPSILESLQVGFDHARAATGRMAWNNVLAYGLPKEEVLVHRLVRLQYQHRMHPEISAFAQRRIYARDDLLKDPPNMAELRPFSYPHYAGRSIWLDVQGQETPSPIRNEKEADVIIEELGKLEAWASTMHREKPWSVAILTFYRGQERCIREKLRKLTDQYRQSRHFVIKQRDRVLLEIELCTVDRYQGHEADIVFLSFVRTEAPGFLNSPNRLNVAVTRARYQLVLVGDRSFLERQRTKAPVCAWLAADMKRLNRVDLRY